MCDEDHLTTEQQRAIEHWHTVKRTVLQALLDDESDALIQASQAVEHCKREIRRLDKSIAELNPVTNGKARKLALDRRADFEAQIRKFGPQAGAGAHIVGWIKLKIGECERGM